MIKEAVETLKNEGTIAYPTETVYGLGADALKENTIEKVFEIKKRPRNKPISLAISSWKMLHEISEINQQQIKLLKEIMPGPVTILAKKTDKVPDILTAGKQKVGIRYPDNKTAIQIIESYGSPITATSANITNKKPPQNHKNIKIPVDHIVKGGKTKQGKSSTIIDLENNLEIKRAGPITRSQIKKTKWL